jgi:hypothetical protein
MARPPKLRAMSFAIIVGVVLMESAIALIPIGIALCLLTTMHAGRVIRDLAIVSCAIAIAIAIYGDLGRQGYRKWRRLRA